MDARQARGRLLAQAQGDRIKCVEGPIWYVPSSTGDGGYLVNMGTGRCTCPDASERCKHAAAVEIIRGARVKVEAPARPVAEQPPPPQRRATLTAQEIENVRAAMAFLKTRLGSQKALAEALHYHPRYMPAVKVNGGLAVLVAGVAGVPVDDVIAGRWPPAGACPHCGHIPPA